MGVELIGLFRLHYEKMVDALGLEPLTLSIKDAGRILGLGRSTIYRLIGERQLEAVKVGNRTLIKTASVRYLVETSSK